MTFLTSQERMLVWFLMASIIVGLIIKYVRSDFTDDRFSKVTESEKIKFKERTDQVDAQKPEKSLDSNPAGTGLEKDANLGAEIININTAGKQELMKLPKIGPVTAERIMRYREDYGSFVELDDLMKVKGIGPKLLERLKNRITF